MAGDGLVGGLDADAPGIREGAVRGGGDRVLETGDGALGEVILGLLGGDEGDGAEDDSGDLHLGRYW